jgi:hypothetical protein
MSLAPATGRIVNNFPEYVTQSKFPHTPTDLVAFWSGIILARDDQGRVTYLIWRYGNQDYRADKLGR